MPTGFTYKVVEGEITTLKEFFWHYVSLNRRDVSADHPVTRYTWNEEHEIGKVREAIQELEDAQGRSDAVWESEFDEYRTSSDRSQKEYNQKSALYLSRVNSLLVQAEHAADNGPPSLQSHHDQFVKMLKDEARYNEPSSPYGYGTLAEYKTSMLEGAEKDVKRAREKLQRRQERISSLDAFLTAAVSTYGDPPHGITVVDSSEMW